jgi:hypothetical protein
VAWAMTTCWRHTVSSYVLGATCSCLWAHKECRNRPVAFFSKRINAEQNWMQISYEIFRLNVPVNVDNYREWLRSLPSVSCLYVTATTTTTTTTTLLESHVQCSTTTSTVWLSLRWILPKSRLDCSLQRALKSLILWIIDKQFSC